MKRPRMLIIQNIISSNIIWYLNNFYRYYRELGYDVEVWFCAVTESNRRWHVSEKPLFPHRFLSGTKIELKGADLFTYFVNPQILKELNLANPDAVFIMGWDIFAYQAAFFWARKHGKKIILRSGSTAWEHSWRRSLSLPLVRYMAGRCDEYIAYGTRSRDYLITLGADPAKIRIVYNDINRRYFTAAAHKYRTNRQKLKRQLGITAAKNIIYVGQLIKRKGIDLLLESYRRLKPDHPDLGLIICGYGPMTDWVKDHVTKYNLKNVVLTGFVEQYDLPRLYVTADCLVMPSREEVWGLVANEAIACGLPVVVSDACGCAPDLIIPGKNGNVFESGNINSLVQKLAPYV